MKNFGDMLAGLGLGLFLLFGLPMCGEMLERSTNSNLNQRVEQYNSQQYNTSNEPLHPAAIIGIFVVVGIIGWIGYSVWKNQQHVNAEQTASAERRKKAIKQRGR